MPSAKADPTSLKSSVQKDLESLPAAADSNSTMSARLVKRRWWGRTLLVQCGGQSYLVKYSPWGLGYETVSVDGVPAVRRRGGATMSHAYHFRLGDLPAVLSVAIPWWCEGLPVRDLTFVRLEVACKLLYQEGRAPRRPLRSTGSAEGFPIIQKQKLR